MNASSVVEVDAADPCSAGRMRKYWYIVLGLQKCLLWASEGNVMRRCWLCLCSTGSSVWNPWWSFGGSVCSAAPAVLGNGSPGPVFSNRSCFLWLYACLHVILYYLFIDAVSVLLVTVLIVLLPIGGLSLQLNTSESLVTSDSVSDCSKVLEMWKGRSSSSSWLIQKSCLQLQVSPISGLAVNILALVNCTCEWLLFQADQYLNVIWCKEFQH